MLLSWLQNVSFHILADKPGLTRRKQPALDCSGEWMDHSETFFCIANRAYLEWSCLLDEKPGDRPGSTDHRAYRRAGACQADAVC